MLSKPINYEILKDAYYSIIPCSEKLGISRETLEREIQDGKIPYYEFRNVKKIKGCDLIEYIEKRRRN